MTIESARYSYLETHSATLHPHGSARQNRECKLIFRTKTFKLVYSKATFMIIGPVHPQACL